VVDYGDVAGVVEAITAILDAPGGREAYRERFAALAQSMTWDHAVDPLVRFCADPHLAADRVAETPAVDLATASQGGDGRRSRRSAISLLEPPPPPTPLWQLPRRALVYAQMGGLPRLWREAQSYVRWLRIRAGR
jgi:hypothetical protein